MTALILDLPPHPEVMNLVFYCRIAERDGSWSIGFALGRVHRALGW